MPVVPAVAGQDLTADTLNTMLDNVRLVKSLSADVTVNNTTTFSADATLTNLTFTMIANAFYTLESFIIYDTNTTADIKVRLTAPTGSNIRAASLSATTAATTSTNSISQLVTDAATLDFVMGGAGSGSFMTGTPCGFIRIGPTAGSLTVTFTQNTANASNTILKRDTWVALSRVA